jgi:hypothetical protein
MPKRLKSKIQKGIQVEYGIYDDKGNYVGDFVPECSVCQNTYFEFGASYTIGICVNCRSVVAHRIDVYPKSEIQVKGKKVIEFAVDILGDFKWVCSACDHDSSFLMNDLETTTCTECGKVTSRNKIAVTTLSTKEAVTWNV